MSKADPEEFALTSVRLWSEDYDWLNQYLIAGERSDFIRSAVHEAIEAVELERSPGQRVRAIVRERLEKPIT